MKTIVIATGNAHKVQEFNRLSEKAGLCGIKFCSAKEFLLAGMPPVVEDSGSFIGNARLKAKALRELVPADCYVLADDSGLCVDALNGLPGVETAYYAGPKASDAENRSKLLRELSGLAERSAHFTCVLLLITPSGEEKIFEGHCFGRISECPADDGFGFGYDPLFVPAGYDKTFAQLEGEVKDALSHRGKAFSALTEYLR